VTDPQLILASASPRRREILGRLTSAFVVRAADIDEALRPGEDPIDYVTRLAEEKAAAVAVAGSVVIGADTSVVLDGEILGKPDDRSDASAMLRRLSGRTHEVITGLAVALVDPGGTATIHRDHERTEVRFVELSDERIAWYVATGEADDKAGAYGLQGAGGLFADHVRGSVSNVIGLPTVCLDRLCRAAGVDLPSYGEKT
jgi:nucleoside triphosphate pyrophosphatase